MMKVKLIQGTNYARDMIANIASICYGRDEASNPQTLLRNLDKLGHYSVFEHAHYTFKIEGISRACLAQLTRHRHASYTVRSQRYCDESEQDFIIPDDILKNNKVCSKFEDLIWEIQELYEDMLEGGVKKEDARTILPQATTTDLYVSLNLRELIHIYNLRTHSSSQKEIRDLLYEMVSEVIEHDESIEELFKRG